LYKRASTPQETKVKYQKLKKKEMQNWGEKRHKDLALRRRNLSNYVKRCCSLYNLLIGVWQILDCSVKIE
jgi:hypothetical protein